MDLFRYFHPHHNPSLRSTAVRLQELGELNQAAQEIRKAVRRAQIRTSQTAVGEIRSEHFEGMITALDYVVESLSAMSEAHPGDDASMMKRLLKERSEAPGWENWSRLLKQRLTIMKDSQQGSS